MDLINQFLSSPQESIKHADYWLSLPNVKGHLSVVSLEEHTKVVLLHMIIDSEDAFILILVVTECSETR